MENIDHDALLEKEPTKKRKATATTDNLSKEEKARLQRAELLKKREQLLPELVRLKSGEEKEAYSIEDSATYMLMERVSFTQMLDRLKERGYSITTYQKSYGGIKKYVLRETLDELRTVVPVE